MLSVNLWLTISNRRPQTIESGYPRHAFGMRDIELFELCRAGEVKKIRNPLDWIHREPDSFSFSFPFSFPKFRC